MRKNEYRVRLQALDGVTVRCDAARRECDSLNKGRMDEFISVFSMITLKLKEL